MIETQQTVQNDNDNNHKQSSHHNISLSIHFVLHIENNIQKLQRMLRVSSSYYVEMVG